MLHGVLGLSFDDGDLTFAFVTRVLGANGEPHGTALGRRSDVPGIVDHDGFAFVALHRDRVLRASGGGLGEGRDGPGARPVLGTRTGGGEGSERAEGGSREQETDCIGLYLHDFGWVSVEGLIEVGSESVVRRLAARDSDQEDGDQERQHRRLEPCRLSECEDEDREFGFHFPGAPPRCIRGGFEPSSAARTQRT